MIKKFELYTIGHSTHSIEEFVRRLTMHSITAVCDVRSMPYSQFTPQNDLFSSREGFIERAYDIQGEKIAYVRSSYEKDNKNSGEISRKAAAGRG